ncbi:MAG TPA: hypothetical protein VK324_01285, partial [Tepidisphaeraceae bacterium]|nr:hypothetical protein [Tepidisphaeraceae bacterium]
FTFPELVMGMAVTAVVLLAMSAMTTAVARGWSQSAAVGAEVQYAAAANRLQRELQGAKYIGYVNAGTTAGAVASVLYWKADNFPGGTTPADVDGKIQYAEAALLEYDPAAKVIYRYQVNAYDRTNYAALSAAQKVDLSQTVTYAGLTAASSAATFKALGWTAVPAASVVTTPLERSVLLRDVTAVQWAAVGTDASAATANVWRPGLEYAVTFQPPPQNGVAAEPLTIYGTATLRGASVKPN